jgi:hypothetical protein
VHRREGATKNGKVLSEYAHRSAVYGSCAGYYPVSKVAFVSKTEIARAVRYEFIYFRERMRVKERIDALAGCHLACGVLFTYPFWTTALLSKGVSA